MNQNNPALTEFSSLVSLWKNNPTCAGGPRAVTKKRASGNGKLTLAQELTFLGILTTIFKSQNGMQGQTPLQTAQLNEYHQNMRPLLGVDPTVQILHAQYAYLVINGHAGFCRTVFRSPRS